MKGIIFALLISYILCIEYLPKYGTIKVTKNSGYFYLNTNEFDDDSTLYIQLNAENGRVDSTLYYEFTDISPNSYSLTPSNSLTPSSTGSSSSSVNNVVVSYTLKYYYSLKKDNNYQYLIIQYSGFFGEYLEIESTRVSWGTFIIIIIFGSIGLIILICVGVFFCLRCRKMRNVEYIATSSASQNQYTESLGEKPYYSNDTQYNSGNYNSNYPPQQQQNIYYEPTPNN